MAVSFNLASARLHESLRVHLSARTPTELGSSAERVVVQHEGRCRVPDTGSSPTNWQEWPELLLLGAFALFPRMRSHFWRDYAEEHRLSSTSQRQLLQHFLQGLARPGVVSRFRRMLSSKPVNPKPLHTPYFAFI